MTQQLLQGKRVSLNVYQHQDLLPTNPIDVLKRIDEARQIANSEDELQFNVVKIREDLQSITFLDYANFFEDGFPLLRQYWTVDLNSQCCRFRSYKDSTNPPVLHRKELLLPKEHAEFSEFQALTKQAETIGLLEDTTNIGFYIPWTSVLREKGFTVSGNNLFPIGNIQDSDEVDAGQKSYNEIARYRTALSRSNFSAPIQLLERLGYLTATKTIFDYGCGKGDDLKGLKLNGISAWGWDPHFAPEQQKTAASIVNLGFVINVIERADERKEALLGAYELAEELLVVSVMLKHLERDQGRPYNDGIVTGRGTFQRYYSQEEIIAYVKATLGEDPIPIAPGIVFIFKDKNEEQRFLSRRANRRTTRIRPLNRAPRIIVSPELRRREKTLQVYENNKENLDALWVSWVELGRIPESDELIVFDEIKAQIGSIKKACAILISSKGDDAEEVVRHAAEARADEIALYFAKLQFERRTPYIQLENGLQRDTKSLYGTYKAAQNAGVKLLYQIADIEAILAACLKAEQEGFGWLDADNALTLHTSLIDRLSPLLRCYINCGLQLYGDASNADLIKIHSRSGKLTLMEFDGFEENLLPRMISRTKILLRKQTIEFYDYVDEYAPPYLYYKSRYINEEFDSYELQVAFEISLESICPDISRGYGPAAVELDNQLSEKRYKIIGMRLERSHTIPNLDDPCGRYFKYRDLIECGETQKETKIDNLPKNPESYTALYDLATEVLDPIIDYFGMIKLTYGFCSHELSKKITKRVVAKLDQHCSFEKGKNGNLICKRGGAAVDFYIEDEDSMTVAGWIGDNLIFDRMYVYGHQNPIHISYSESRAKLSFLLTVKNGKLIPRMLSDYSLKG